MNFSQKIGHWGRILAGRQNFRTGLFRYSLAGALTGKQVNGRGDRAARQYLAAGLIDEMHLNLVPALLGEGARLFENAGDDLDGLELTRTIATSKVVHLKFER